ncbi:MAG: FtsX-like permease family protein [Chloroflexi bacterium]|nr:FtsX-like permease family protein [Chloroflexota bacterium]
MRILFLFGIAWKRLTSRGLLTLVFGLSSALALGIIVCVPVFADAVSQHIIRDELGLLRSDTHRSPFVIRFQAYPSARQPLAIADVSAYQQFLSRLVVREIDLPIAYAQTEIQSPRHDLRLPADHPTDAGRSADAILSSILSDADKKTSVDGVYVVVAPGVEEQIEIVQGAPFGEDADANTLAVWVRYDYALEMGLQVGDRYTIQNLNGWNAPQVPVRIAGLWEARDPEAKFWGYTEQIWYYEGILLTSRQEYERHLYPTIPGKVGLISWCFVLDERRMNLARGEHYVEGLATVQAQATAVLPGGIMSQDLSTRLLAGQARKNALTLILLSFALPLILISFCFMGIVSWTLNRSQARELAMLNSRGSGRLQIMALVLIETLILLALSLPVGLALGLFLARILGYSLSFLQFIRRSPLPVYLAAADWRLMLFVLALVIFTRLAPAWAAAKRTVVAQEREHVRPSATLDAARLLLMAFALAACYYAYQRLRTVGSLGLVSWQPGDPRHDPLLLIAPSLFVLTLPLVLVEGFLLFIRPLAGIGSLLPTMAAYLGLTDLGRDGRRYRLPMYMLILCLASGVFYASLARSADSWLLEHRRYAIGADLVLQPPPPVDENGEEVLLLTPWEELAALPMSTYEEIPGVARAMAVGNYTAVTSPAGRLLEARLLAIDRYRFPSVAYYRPDYAPTSLGTLMNLLAGEENALLMPRATAAELSLEPGSALRVTLIVGEDRLPFEFKLVGTFDYFPTMFPEEAPLFVANLSYLQTQTAGMIPHGLWVRLEPTADSETVSAEIRRRALQGLEETGNLPNILAEDRARLERVGLFGMLSVSFLAGALLAAAGFMLHTASTIQTRGIRYAAMRALGLDRGTILSALFIEYALTLGYGVASGIGLGIVAAQLYVPFIQVTEQAKVPVPPFIPLIDHEKIPWLATSMLLVMILAEGVVLVRLLRIRVFEALRLGAQE